MRIVLLFMLFFCLSYSYSFAQTKNSRILALEQRLEEYSIDNPAIDKEIDISFSGSIQEFVVAFSKETKLNVTVDPMVKQDITTNFSDIPPRDILVYLCRSYDLDLSFSGSIMSLFIFDKPPVPEKTKGFVAAYNSYNDKLTLVLNRDTLDQVLQKISASSGKNIIARKGISNEIVSVQTINTSLEEALDLLAIRNELSYIKDDNGFYIFDKVIAEDNDSAKNSKNQSKNNQNSSRNTRNKKKNTNLQITSAIDSTSGVQLISADITDTKVNDVLQATFESIGVNFIQVSTSDKSATFSLEDVTLEELLDVLLLGSGLSYAKNAGIYLIDNEKSLSLAETKVVQLKHRAVTGIVEVIPKELIKDLEAKEFVELNAIVVSGASSKITELELFLNQIDKTVPVINIELLIVDVNKSANLTIGTQIGKAEQPVTSQGTLFPNLDFTFSDKGINQLLGLLTGSGVVNLGQVKPGFYASLQAVETSGKAKVQSKPKLSTINGHEAVFTLGETRYFQVQRTTLQGNQTPISLQDRVFESVNADFTIKILPIVSGDENVTLNITVDQSDFIGPIQTDAPPPQISRNFNSNIRVKNGEMIVLGGLERKSVEDNGTGLPWLSRIPILKWFVSQRNKAKDSSKLLLFVKPTVYY